MIIDENISWRLKRLLPQWDVLPANEIIQDKRQSDNSIWQHARKNGYHIVTFDEDFVELQNLYSHPPKIIWLRLGNCSTKEIAERLLQLEDKITEFLFNDDAGVYEVYL